MKKSLHLIVLMLFCIQYSSSVQAQSVQELKSWNMDIDKVGKMHRLLEAYTWMKQFSGVVIVAKDEHPVFKYTTSYANLDYKIPNSLNTRYNLSNITHILTATIIMQLIEEGKISRYNYIKEYLPSLPLGEFEQITIHHLLTHTSGIKDYYQTPEYISNFTEIKTIDDLTAIILKQPLLFGVGTKVEISESNYVLLAKIIEEYAQKPFREYMQDKIFDLADMQDSGAYFWDEIVNNKAIGYTFKESGTPSSPPSHLGAFPFGADAVYSTSEDLLKFMIAFNQHLFITAESIKKMLSYGFPIADGTTFQYGWRTKKLGTQDVMFQNGSIEGLSVDLRHYPGDGYTLIVLSSYFEDKAIELADHIEKVLYEENYVVARHPLAFFLNEIIKEDGIEFLVDNIDFILEVNNYKLDKVWTLYSLGYDLMDTGRMKEAGEIFKINIAKFPNQPMAYDSMGAFYNKNGNYELALQNFQQKLKFIPGDKRALSMVNYLLEKITTVNN
ncbi:MAG: serine hydrolase [Chitinophagales bacterium]